MDFLKKTLEKVKDVNAKVSSSLEQVKEQMKPTFKKLADSTTTAVKEYFNLDDDKGIFKIENELHMITPRIYIMSFPTAKKTPLLSNYLNEKHGCYYYIWNVSEHSYSAAPFNNQVVEYCMAGYPCLPLAVMINVCKSIISWLLSDEKNIAVIHCQTTKGRSALVIICLLCLLKIFPNPSEAMLHLCKFGRLKEDQLFFPSQKLYLRYFGNIHVDHIKPNMKKVKIKKFVMNEIPVVFSVETDKGQDPEQEDTFRPYIQIFKGSKAIYNSLNSNAVRHYTPTDLSVWFEPDLDAFGDLLIRCKHFHSEEERYPVFRLMMNTGFFFDNLIRFYKRDIDFSPNVQVSENFFVDIYFTQLDEDVPKEVIDEWDVVLNEIDRIEKKDEEAFKKLGDLEGPPSPIKPEMVPESPENTKNGEGLSPDNKTSEDKKEEEEELPTGSRGEENTEKKEESLPKKPREVFTLNEDPSPSPSEDNKDKGSEDSPKKESEEKANPELVEKIMNKIKEDDDLDVDDQEIDDYLTKLEQNEDQ